MIESDGIRKLAKKLGIDSKSSGIHGAIHDLVEGLPMGWDKNGNPIKMPREWIPTESPDWDEHDESAPGFIKNKTHCSKTEVLPETTISYNAEMDAYMLTELGTVRRNAECTVVFNGTEYSCPVYVENDGDFDIYVLGNYSLMTETGDTGEPFVMIIYPEEFALAVGFRAMIIVIDGSTDDITMEIYMGEDKPLDCKYLPKHLQWGETETASDTLEWDGNTEGLKVYADSLYKISDVILTNEDFANGGILRTRIDSTGEETSYNVIGLENGVLVTSEGKLYVITVMDRNLAAQAGCAPGIYSAYASTSAHLASLTINGYTGFTKTTVTPIPQKFLPDNVGTTVFYNKGTDKYIYKDEACTVKATKADIPMGTTFVVSVKKTVGDITVDITMIPVNFQTSSLVDYIGAYVISIEDSLIVYDIYYTAEYTAE